MSHRASSWLADLPADAMNASSFRVLFHLANAHNSLREPTEACFPQQSALLKATGLSNGGLNNALNALELAGLIRRIASTDHDGRRRTYYILGCDFGLLDDQTPKNGVRPNSNLDATKLQSGGGANSNSVEFDIKAEPVKEPVKEPVRDFASSQHDFFGSGKEAEKLKDDGFSAFWEAYPKCPRKTGKPQAHQAWTRILAGKAKDIPKTDGETIVAAVKRFAASNPDPQFIPLPTTWLNGARWDQFPPSVAPSGPRRLGPSWGEVTR